MHGSTQTVRHNRRCPVPLACSGHVSAFEPDKNVWINHPLNHRANSAKSIVHFLLRHSRRQFQILLHDFDQICRNIGQTDESGCGKRRTGRHAQSRQNAGICPQQRHANVFQIVRCDQGRLNIACGFDTRFTVGVRSKAHKLVVVHVHRLGNVCFPPVRLVPVDCHLSDARTRRTWNYPFRSDFQTYQP